MRSLPSVSGGDPWAPYATSSSVGEPERFGADVEQAQSAGTVVVVRSETGGIVAEALRIVARSLGLKLPGELADVVQGKEVANQRIRGLAWQPEQAGEALAESTFARQQHLANRGYIEGVVRQRMPPGSALGIGRLGLSPETEHVHRAPGSYSNVATWLFVDSSPLQEVQRPGRDGRNMRTSLRPVAPSGICIDVGSLRKSGV